MQMRRATAESVPGANGERLSIFTPRLVCQISRLASLLFSNQRSAFIKGIQEGFVSGFGGVMPVENKSVIPAREKMRYP